MHGPPESGAPYGVRAVQTDPRGRLRRSLYAEAVDVDSRAAAAIFAGAGLPLAAYGPWQLLAALRVLGGVRPARAPR